MKFKRKKDEVQHYDNYIRKKFLIRKIVREREKIKLNRWIV